MNTLYLDIFSGLSGDMFLGAMIDLGVDFATLEAELQKLNLPGYHLHHRRAQQNGVAGTKVDVHLDSDRSHGHPQDARAQHEHDHAPAGGSTQVHSRAHGRFGHPPAHDHHHEQETHPHRTFASIRDLIRRSTLSAWVKEKSVAVFERVAEAEGRIHGLPPDQVRFHEVGAVDSIVDIVGACLALELLGKPRVLAGPVVDGTGFVQCAHGCYPLPAPATLAILGRRGIPITQCEEPQELLTPTGAALLAEFAESFGPLEGLIPDRIGFGLGTRENRTRPNAVRAILGRTTAMPASSVRDWEADRVAVLETNLDDISSELLGHFVDRALSAGALDVFHTAIQMKKSRPGVLLTLLCAEPEADRFAELILRETSAFGVRRTVADRRKLRRRFTLVHTPWGDVTLKEGLLDGVVIQATPEYESCRQIAAQAGVSIREVYEAVLRHHAAHGS